MNTTGDASGSLRLPTQMKAPSALFSTQSFIAGLTNTWSHKLPSAFLLRLSECCSSVCFQEPLVCECSVTPLAYVQMPQCHGDVSPLLPTLLCANLYSVTSTMLCKYNPSDKQLVFYKRKEQDETFNPHNMQLALWSLQRSLAPASGPEIRNCLMHRRLRSYS